MQGEELFPSSHSQQSAPMACTPQLRSRGSPPPPTAATGGKDTCANTCGMTIVLYQWTVSMGVGH